MMRSRRAILTVIAALVWLAAAAGVGCSRQNGDEGAPPVDTEIMAFLSEARALHHQANIKEDSGDLPGAISAMERLVVARRPHPEKATPEVDEVLSDGYARLAELRLRKGDLAGATLAIETGRKHAPEGTYFQGHLVEIHGLVEESRAGALADAGKPAEAAEARERAIQLLETAVRIQDQVVGRSLNTRDARDAGAGEKGR